MPTPQDDLREQIIKQVMAWDNANQRHYAEYLLKRMATTVPHLALPTWADLTSAMKQQQETS